MLVSLPWPVVVALDAAAWITVSLWCGWRAARRPAGRLCGGGRADPERAERWWRIRAWKDRLPEAGTWFGGLSKRRLPPGADHRARLTRFAAESRRAELAHAWILASVPVFALWNPPWLFATMVGFAVVANVPCLLVARYNQARVRAVLSSRPR